MDPGLQSDFESLRIIPRQLSLEDLTKVWTAFKEDFQRAVGYEVMVVRVQRPQQRPVNPPALNRAISVVPSISPSLSLTLSTAAAVTDSNVYFSGAGLTDPSLRIEITDAARLGYPADPLPVTPQVDPVNGRFFQVPSSNPQMQPGPKLIQAVITDPTPSVRPVASAPVTFTLLPETLRPLLPPPDRSTGPPR